MPRDLKYDVVIVGLGPAGSSLAYLLKDSGLKVAGIEVAGPERVWGKPCGDAIGKGHFLETGLPLPKEPALMQVVNAVDIYSPSEEVRLRLAEPNGGFMIDRNKYGFQLVEEAQKSGVDIYLRTHALKPIIEDGKLAGVYAKQHGEEESAIRFYANIVVDATGSGGAIKRKLPPDWPVVEPLKPTDSAVAFRKIVEVDYDIEEPDVIRIYINENIAPGGYWWLFPKGKRIANIGIGVQRGRGFPHPRELYTKYLDARPDTGRVVRVLNEAGALLPTRRPANTIVWDNFISIGDNAYTVNPIHGGGMGYAMTAAMYAAKTIKSAFEIGDFTVNTLWQANTGYMRTTGAKQAGLDILRIYLQTLTNEEVEWAMRNGVASVESLMETSISGEMKKLNITALEKAKLLVRMLGRPTKLLELLTVGEYMSRVKKLYLQYPEKPEELPKWVDKVESLYKEFKAKIGVDW
ncbi:MAG: geranylgeranyl reductase family protein [Aeropyrum sp.]|nr:geranylgeranyl reductase family protein [Aeropyrum sp.]MCE4616315.1 geranylgeranyl reductase family protein [Aeropyrum sp.]